MEMQKCALIKTVVRLSDASTTDDTSELTTGIYLTSGSSSVNEGTGLSGLYNLRNHIRRQCK